MRILIVDDDEMLLDFLRLALESLGHEVEAARNGVDALRKLRASPRPVVICDWVMPGMNGLELCRHIRAEMGEDGVYIIMLTGRDGRSDQVDGRFAGADDFLPKPPDIQELASSIRTAQQMLAM